MRTPIPNLPGYFLDKKGMICYRLNGNGKWMYCKKIEGKPGWVWVFKNGMRVPYHQSHTAELMLKKSYEERPFRTKPIVEPPTEEPPPSAIQPSKNWM